MDLQVGIARVLYGKDMRHVRSFGNGTKVVAQTWHVQARERYVRWRLPWRRRLLGDERYIVPTPQRALYFSQWQQVC